MWVCRWLLVLALLGTACAEGPSAGRGSAGPAETSPAEPGTRVFFAWTGQITVVDIEAATSETIQLRELAPVGLVRRGDHLVFGGDGTYALDAQEPTGDPVLIAEDSWYFVPSANPDRVWVAVLDRKRSDAHHLVFSEIREVTAEGQITARGPAMGDAWMDGAAEAGVVFESPEHDDLVVWDPMAQQVVRSFGNPPMGASHGNLVVWCDAWCPELHLTDVLTGAERIVQPPAGYDRFDGWSGEFTPDGRLFAVPVGNPPRYEGPGAAAIVDVATGDVTVIPGSEEEGGIPGLTWDPTGTRLFLVLGQHGRFELRYFDVGADGAQTAAVDPPQDLFAMASA
ncbi:MAG: hypothetical protein ACRDKA_06030 [Actinomycetota bacterium]